MPAAPISVAGRLLATPGTGRPAPAFHSGPWLSPRLRGGASRGPSATLPTLYPAAGERDDLAAEEVSLVRGQVHREAGRFLRPSQPSGRDVLDQARELLGIGDDLGPEVGRVLDEVL